MSTPVQEFSAEELADLVGFEPDEIKLNSAGKYSQRQIKRLRIAALCYLPILIYGIAVFINNLNCLQNCLIYSSQESAFTPVLYLGRTLIVFLVIGFTLYVILRVTLLKPVIKSRIGLMTTRTGWITTL